MQNKCLAMRGLDWLKNKAVFGKVKLKKIWKQKIIKRTLTNGTLKENKFYKVFSFRGEKSNAILSQIRLFDSKRLKYKIGKMSANDYNDVKEKLIALIG